MAGNDSKWLKMAPNGSKSVKPLRKMPKVVKKCKIIQKRAKSEREK